MDLCKTFSETEERLQFLPGREKQLDPVARSDCRSSICVRELIKLLMFKVFEMVLMDFWIYREMGCTSPFFAAWSASSFPK